MSQASFLLSPSYMSNMPFWLPWSLATGQWPNKGKIDAFNIIKGIQAMGRSVDKTKCGNKNWNLEGFKFPSFLLKDALVQKNECGMSLILKQVGW